MADEIQRNFLSTTFVRKLAHIPNSTTTSQLRTSSNLQDWSCAFTLLAVNFENGLSKQFFKKEKWISIFPILNQYDQTDKTYRVVNEKKGTFQAKSGFQFLCPTLFDKRWNWVKKFPSSPTLIIVFARILVPNRFICRSINVGGMDGLMVLEKSIRNGSWDKEHRLTNS